MKSKKIRTKGKVSFSKCFQELKKDDIVAVVEAQEFQPRFPKRLQGNVGIVEEKRGKDYMIKIKKKKFLINPIHLKKIKQINENDKK